MKPEYKKPWIDALRSGKYEQGQRYLLKDGKYCCLGVLCEINGLEKSQDHADESAYRFYHGYESLLGVLPGNFDRLVGIEREDQSILRWMNDGRNPEGKSYSFSEIADWIEENL